jgi:uncharacterized protein (DUF2141 family)
MKGDRIMHTTSKLIMLASICGCAHVAGPPPHIGSAASGDELIVVDIDGLRSAKGVVKCDIFDSAQGFPKHSEKARIALQVAIDGDRARCEFKDLPPGIYAVAFLHDENRNGHVDTGFFGVPVEGQGASNDARGSFGPPSFDDARFEYMGGRAAMRLKAAY